MKNLIYLIIVLLFTACHAQRYSLKKAITKPIDFGTPSWIADFNNANISEGDLYAGHTIRLKENVEIDSLGYLHLYTKPYNEIYHNWWGSKFCNWSTGWVDFRDTHQEVFGTWEVEMKLPNGGWPAFWLLHERHSVPETQIQVDVINAEKGSRIIHFNCEPENKLRVNLWCFYRNEFIGHIHGITETGIILDRTLETDISDSIAIGMDHIIPECDIMELFPGGIRNTLHYGYTWDKYRANEKGAYVVRKPDLNKIYKFAVTVSKDGYQFYVDGYKSFFTSKGVVDEPLFMILNNAKQKDELTGEATEMIVYKLNYYKPEN